MAVSTQLEDLQSRLEQSLTELGYSGKMAKLPAAMLGSEKMTNFVSWLIGNLSPDNHLTTAELAKLVATYLCFVSSLLIQFIQVYTKTRQAISIQ